MKKYKTLQQLLLGALLILLVAGYSSCKPDKMVDDKSEPKNSFFDEADLGAFGSETKLFINATFSECGEWGGHDENMVIYAKKDKEFYLDYKRFKVNCDSVSSYYGTPDFQKLELVKTMKLDEANKISISNYIQRMAKSKIEERDAGNAGNYYSVIKSDSTLVIKVYGYNIYDELSYNKLLIDLNLPVSTKK